MIDDDRRKRDNLDAIARLVNDILNKILDPRFNSLNSDENKTFNFSITVGPEGISYPNSDLFDPSLDSLNLDPLVEVSDIGADIVITAELPGIQKKDLHLTANHDLVLISSRDEELPYHSEVELECEIDPESGTAAFKNGVLELRFKKV
ncbi:MAG: Hsp20/alpha crystallin family protein [Candidatus Diapherotrites archaeon]|nr:Hsp20/alpha crystallin family protein [Candidatus Diapherotrites archaeon]